MSGKDIFVKDLATYEGQSVLSFFVVAAKQKRLKRNGDPYVAFTLADRTGLVEAKLWEKTEAADAVEIDTYIKVRATVTQFAGRWELAIAGLRVALEHEVEVGDYLRKTTRDIDVMWAELGGHLATVRDPNLQQLLQAFLQDEEVAGRLRLAPAAKVLHHAWIGGLLEHVLSLCNLACLSLQNYLWLNRDLVLAGIFLHDIGKIYELSFDRKFGYTDEGQLAGHITIGVGMLRAKALGMPAFPPELLLVLEHMVLSHHGVKEFGSPVEPLFPEAAMVHYLDNIDSKLEAMREVLGDDRDGGVWSAYSRALGKPLLRVDRFLPRQN